MSEIINVSVDAKDLKTDDISVNLEEMLTFKKWETVNNHPDLECIKECAESVGIEVEDTTAFTIPFIAEVMRRLKGKIHDMTDRCYEAGYKRGLEDGRQMDVSEGYKAEESGYQRGLKEAWECAKEILFDGTLSRELLTVFKTKTFSGIINKYTAAEAIQKLKDWRETQKVPDNRITVGDEVYLKDKNYKSVVVNIFESDNEKCTFITTQRGTWDVCGIKELHKTGRHFPEIEKVLNQLKEVTE